jgi:hypothetical protein
MATSSISHPSTHSPTASSANSCNCPHSCRHPRSCRPTHSLAVDSLPVFIALISLVSLEVQALQDDNHLVLLWFP